MFLFSSAAVALLAYAFFAENFTLQYVAENHTTSGLVAALAQHMGSAPARGVRPRQVTS